MSYLLHCDTEDVCDVIDGQLYRIPANEPFEVADEFIAERIVEHKSYQGLVAVHVIKDKSGVRFDMENALLRAQETLKLQSKRFVDEYVRTQMEDRVKKGLPALPPEGRALRLIEELGIDLEKQYGLKPVGFQQSAPDGDRISQLENLVKALAAQLAQASSPTPAPLEAEVEAEPEVAEQPEGKKRKK